MTTSNMVRELCEKMNISISELARRIGQLPQNFNKKLKRGTVSLEELLAIANVLEILFEQGFTLPDGQSIKIYSDKYGG
ncbi:MAG: helix-turn-helix transcriptional regulator [Lachnospiraceae bacterium]|nr:helix-turn-helix transcriptional regulator [Lachnospiraceae bacterium]